MRLSSSAVVLVVVLTTAACGDQPSRPTVVAPAPADPSVPAALSAVPELDPTVASWDTEVFHFLADDGRLVGRTAWSACLGSGCWDGAPHLAGTIPSVGSPGALWFAVPWAGWDFEHVSFHAVDRECGGRVVEVPAEKVGARSFRIDPAGPAGEWRVDVFGRGADGGDAIASVRWTTTTDGTMPPPRATATLFFDDDGERVTYGGPTLALVGLARTPRTATGTWTVTDAEGTTVTVPLVREKNRCERTGALSLAGPELTAEQQASLRGRTLTYTVDLRLDGTAHTATAVWTQRPSREDERELELVFAPALPAYVGD